MTHTFASAGKDVLVTGAAGFTGSMLVRKLETRGAAVRAFVRPGIGPEDLQHLPARLLRGSIVDPDAIAEAMAGVTHVFHLATLFRSPHVSYQELYDVHVRSTMRLAEAAARLRPMPRFVHVSTVGVHGHIESPPADESYPLNPRDDYQATKAEAEVWLREFGKREGLPVTVVRPTPIYGPGDRRLFKLFWMVAKSMVLTLGSGKQLYHLVHVDDLTDFLLHVADLPEAAGEVYICGGDEALRFDDLVQIIAECYNRNPHIVRLPVKPVLALAEACERILPRLGIHPPIFKRRVHFFLFDRSFEISKMLQTGFQPRYRTREGLRETAQWYLDNAWIQIGRRTSTAFTLVRDLAAADLAVELLMHVAPRI
jgi:nucleoside-diphosphate-sugar epimerase